MFTPGEADGGERLQRCGAALARGHAAIEQGQLDVLQRRRASQQVVALKDEADVVAAEQGALIAR